MTSRWTSIDWTGDVTMPHVVEPETGIGLVAGDMLLSGAEEWLESVGGFEVEGGDLCAAPDAASPTPLDEKSERPVD